MSYHFKNFARTTVATAPSPALTGTTLSVPSGHGSLFPTAPFNVVIWPIGQQPTSTNAEIATVTLKSGDDFTLVRAQEVTSARVIQAGDQIAENTTKGLLELLERGVSVKAFGAKGDGSTDDTVAIQAAVDSGYPTIYFPNGIYRCGEIDPPTTLHALIGESSQSVFQPIGSMAGANGLFYFNGIEGLRVAHLSANVDTTTYSSLTVFNFNSCSRVLVEDIYMPEAGSFGIIFGGCSHAVARDCVIDSVVNAGIVAQGASATDCWIMSSSVAGGVHCFQVANGSNLHIINCYANGSSVFGFSINAATSSSVEGCVSIDTEHEGINADNSPGSRILNNRVYWTGSASTDFGISVYGHDASNCDNSMVSGNFASSSYKAGICLLGKVSNCIVEGNNVVNCNLSAAAAWGGITMVDADCTGNFIHGNNIYDALSNHTYGVNEYDNGGGNPDYNRFEQNRIINVVTAPTNLLGTHSTTDEWRSFTSTVSAGTGTITTASCVIRHAVIGRTCQVYINALVTTNGTGGQDLRVTLPYPVQEDASNSAGAVSGRATVSGKAVQGFFNNTNVAILYNYDGTYPASNGERIFASGCYELDASIL